MNIIKVDCLPLSIFVGYERENDARGVTFDYSAWAEQYGEGVLQLLVQRPGDADPYPVVLTAEENNTAVWLLSATDTAVKGWLEIQLIFTVGSVVAKTAVLPVLVDRSLAAGATPPDPYETWLETLTELAEQILHTTQPPEIRDGYWYIFDPDTGEYINSGVKAEGEDGVGITGAQLNADYTLTLTFSDGTSYTTPSIRGAQGATGPTPQLSIGTVTTGAAGSSAAVEISGTPEAPVLNFTIPRGDTGEVSEAELQAALLDKADVITDTASGAIASFPDGAAAPVKALTVAVEPVQDLHGYDAPWPAGGGANKLQLTGRRVITSDAWTRTTPRDFSEPSLYVGISMDGYFYNSYISSYSVTEKSVNVLSTSGGYGLGFTIDVQPETQYAIYYDNPTLLYMAIGFYDADGVHLSYQIWDNSGKNVFTTPQGCYHAIIVFSPPVNTEVTYVHPILVNGSTLPDTWTPYSNECPISGWSSVGIERTGKNLADASAETVKILGSANGYIYNATGSHVIRIEGGKTYTISMKNAQAIFTSTCATFPEVGDPTVDAYTGTAGQAVTSKTIVTSAAAKYLVFHFGSFDYEELMVNEGATAEPYSAFVGNSYNFSLGQTVYGGTLDAVNRKMAADIFYGRVDAMTSCWGASNGYARFYRYLNDTSPNESFHWPSASGEMKNCDTLRIYTISMYNRNAEGIALRPNSSGAYISLSLSTDRLGLTGDETKEAMIAAINTWLNNNSVHVSYPMATPIEISLTPEEIKTLKGTNNFRSDAGDVSVEYRADTKLYIEKKITAAIAAALNS